VLLAFQVFLGIATYRLKLEFRDAPQPMPPLIYASTAHVAVGAIVLATSLILTLQVFRRVKTSKAPSEIRAHEKATA
jgi:hypothetical protein